MRPTTRQGVALAAAALTVAAGLTGAPPAASAAVTLTNPGFESGLDGWTVTGATAAAKTEGPGRDDSAGRLTHWADTDYAVTTAQQVSGLSRGWWTASAWVKGGGDDTSRLSLTCGRDGDAITLPPTLQDDDWVRVTVSTYVKGGTCTVGVETDGPGGSWVSVDDVALEPGAVAARIRGGDLSALAKNEALGARYATPSGRKADPVRLLAADGMNLARLRVFVDPADGYNTTPYVVRTAQRARAAGMKILIDFHYSDTWADPGHQSIPAAWVGSTPEQLAQHVYDHTHEVMAALRRKGIRPDYVQVGNEINSGMLWPYGQTWDVDTSDDVTGAQWDDLAAFLTAGSDAVKDVSPSSQVILHLTNINNGIGGLTWWFDEVTARNVPFDLIGLSYYAYWHGSLADLQQAITAVSERYDRDVMVVETAYPFTLEDDDPAWENIIDQPSELVQGYPATPEGQASFVRAVLNATVSAPGGRGLGAVYWEPTWTAIEGNGWDPADPTSGNAWENQALFDFDDRLLPAAEEFAPLSKH